MENHPIPQDVTGFQFKLIGNMTVKQFAYLAVGVILAGILWKLPINFLIKFPFCTFFAILGVGLAYIPISGRPMDQMIGNYIKALISPTEFVYQKNGGKIYFPGNTSISVGKGVRQYTSSFSPFPKDKLKAYLESLDTQPKNKLDEKENNFLMSVSDLATGNPTPLPSYQPIITAPTVSINPQPAVDDQKELTMILQSAPVPQIIQSVISPVKPDIAAQPISFTEEVAKPTPAPKEPTKTIKPLTRGFGRVSNTPSMPDSPSLIIGITKDARGNALSNILVEVKDKDNNPVRAFKTNEFGRFASATPLANGTYTVEFEDPKAQNRFEKITINVTGQIIMPIEASSIDAREELRKSLFSTN